MSCKHTAHEHEQEFEKMFTDLFELSQEEGSPLTSILNTLDLTWEDIPTLQAQEIVSIFHAATTIAGYAAVEHSLGDSLEQRVILAEHYKKTAEMFERKSANLADLRAVIEVENAYN